MQTIDPASFLNPSPAPRKPAAPTTPPKAKSVQPEIVSPGNFVSPAPEMVAAPPAAVAQKRARPGVLTLWSGVVLTVIYLYFELRYSRGLLDLMAHGDVSQATIDAFTQEGKLLAAIGLSWALVRPVVMRVRGFFSKTILFILAAGALYWGLDTGYRQIMLNLSPDTKLAGVQLTTYRELLLTGRARQAGIVAPVSNGNPEQVMTMTAFPLLMTDAVVRRAAQDALIAKVSRQAHDYSDRVARDWPQYQKRNKAMAQAYAQYLAGSRDVEKYRGQPAMAQRKFSQVTGGMKPNAKATYEEFTVQVHASTMPAARMLSATENTVLFVRNPGATDQQTIRNRDIPLGMTQAAYQQHFNRLINDIKAESVPDISNIAQYPKVLEADSALFIPMLAMLISLASIIINVGLIGWMTLMNVAGQYGVVRKLGIVVVAGFFAAVLMAVPGQAFVPASPLGHGETVMQQRLGVTGKIMSRLMSVQKVVYAKTAMLSRPITR